MSDVDRQLCAVITHRAALLVWAHELGKMKSKAAVVGRCRTAFVELAGLTWDPDDKRSVWLAHAAWHKHTRIYCIAKYRTMEDAAVAASLALGALRAHFPDDLVANVEMVRLLREESDDDAVRAAFWAARG